MIALNRRFFPQCRYGTMTNLSCLTLAVLLTFAVAMAAEPIDGIGPTGPVAKLPGTYQFTEGPAYDGQRYLYFTDIPASRIMRFDTSKPDLAPEEFIQPSMMCNGLMLDGAGKLIGCRMETGEVVAFDLVSKQATPITKGYNGKRFNASNDLVIDKTGGVYFSDPRYRAPEPWPQGIEAVYYRDSNGKVTRIAEGIVAPNGVILSPDESKFYIVPSMESNLYVFDVESPGKLSNKRVLFQFAQPANQKDKGGDGLTIDSAGNLYVTTALGLQVVSPAGKLLGIIEIPEQPANVTFGGAELSTLYVTARTGFYAVPTKAKGHRFSGIVKP